MLRMHGLCTCMYYVLYIVRGSFRLKRHAPLLIGRSIRLLALKQKTNVFLSQDYR